MCGIVGLFFKRSAATASLGPLLAGMLAQMRERGPDSTGFALYSDEAPPGAFKVTLRTPEGAYDWAALEGEFGSAFPLACPVRQHGSHAVFTIGGDPEPVLAGSPNISPSSTFSALASASRCSRMLGYRTTSRRALTWCAAPAPTGSAIRGWRRKAR